MRSAIRVPLREGLSIRLITAPCFVATKLDAFRERGKGDYLASHDFEDVLSVVDGRPELVEEFRQADRELRNYVASVFADLLADEGFLNAFPGLVIEGSPADRSPIVLARLCTIAQMSQD